MQHTNEGATTFVFVSTTCNLHHFNQVLSSALRLVAHCKTYICAIASILKDPGEHYHVMCGTVSDETKVA